MMQKKSKDWKLANPKCNHWRLITGCKLEERKGGSNSEHACRWAGHDDAGGGERGREERVKIQPPASLWSPATLSTANPVCSRYRRWRA